MIVAFIKSHKVLISIYLAVVIVLGLLGYYFYLSDKAKVYVDRSNELMSIGKLKQSAVSHWLRDRNADAEYLFNYDLLYHSLNNYLSVKSRIDSLYIVSILSSVAENHDYLDIFIVDPRDRIVIDINPKYSFNTIKDSINSAIKNKKIIISNIYFDSNYNGPVLDIYVPLIYKNNPVPMLIMKVDLAKDLYTGISSWYSANSSGEAFIFTLENDSIKYICPLKYMSLSNGFLIRPLTTNDLLTGKVINKSEGITEGIDYRGEEVLAYVCTIKNMPWYLVTKIDLSEIYTPVLDQNINRLFILGLIIFSGGLFLLYNYTRINYKNLAKVNEAEKKFKSIFSNSSDAIVILENEIFIDCNPSAEKLYGLSKINLIGKSPVELSPEYQTDGELSSSLARKYISNALNGLPQNFEWIHLKNDKPIYTVIALSVFESDGKKLLAAFLHDITERKKAEEALISAKEKAEEVSSLKSNFLTNMSHELRTPMVGILGYAELLNTELTDPNYKDMSNSILRSGKRLMETLNSILDISRIEANKQNILLSEIDLKQIVNEAADLFKHTAKEKGLYLKVNLPEKPISFISDREIVIKILNNIISNAVKYTKKGGIIIKATTTTEDSEKFVQIDIIDSGIGIRSKDLGLIYEPFRQVSEGLTRYFEGTGLGLSITKKFIELLNGKIECSSEFGKGSTFSVSFPLSEPENKIDQNDVHKSNDYYELHVDRINKRPLLLVEDDISNADIILAYLKDYFLTDHVISGFDAIDICNQKKYDAVLMDINLKEIDGIETFNRIRKIDNYYSEVPVIAITAYAMKGDEDKFLSLGFSRYLSKPFKRYQIINLLSDIFKKV